MEEHDGNGPNDGRMTRRKLLGALGGAGVAAVAAPAFLAACGSSSKKTTSTTAASSSPTTASSATTAASSAASGGATTAGSTAGSTPASGDVGTTLASLLQIDPTVAGKGKDWQMGAVLAQTGAGAFYGKTMSRGIDLAVKHIAAAGGPNIKVLYYDHKSGDAAAGKAAITDLGTKHVPAKLASYGDDLFVMLDGTAQYKIFTLDGGGGTSIPGQGKPYFWGTRAITPNDTLPGLFKWLKDSSPNAKTVGLTGWDVGDPSNGIIKADILKKISDGGFTFNNLYELFPPNTEDFASLFPKLKSNQPDVLLAGMYGQDPGSFINQSQTAGLKSQIIGFEFTPDGVNASKGAYDKIGWTFTYDYFDAANPISPLAKLFVDEFKKQYNDTPDFYAANFYENTLVMWEVIRRVLKKGGDINDGAQLDQALRDNLTVVSVYGGDANTVGTYTLDATTHSVIKRGMGVFTYKSGKVTAQAFFDIGGANYRKV